MKKSKTKELAISNGLNTLKKDDMSYFRGGNNSDRPANADTKDEVM